MTPKSLYLGYTETYDSAFGLEAGTCQILKQRRDASDAPPKKVLQSLVVKGKRKYGGSVTTEVDEDKRLRLKKEGKRRRSRHYKQCKAFKNYIELHDLNRKMGE